MPKRLLDDSLFASPSLAAVSPRCQDAFPRLLLIADDFGCFDANVRVILGRAWSLRKDVTEEDIETWLGELAAGGMLQLWTEGGRRYGFLTGWFGPHGQRNRGEYDAKKNPSGSRRKTPTPPPYTPPAANSPRTRGTYVAAEPPRNRGESNEKAVLPGETTTRGELAANPLLRSQSQSQSQSQAQAGSDRSLAAEPPRNGAAPSAAERLARFQDKRLTRSAAKYPLTAQLHALLATEFPEIGYAPKPEDAERLEARCVKRGVEAFARDCVEFADEEGQVPNTLTWFARCLASIDETPEPRAPGENPKPGDPDFNDPGAWPDYGDYLKRTDGKTWEESTGLKRPVYRLPKTPEEEAEERAAKERDA